MRKIVFTNGCFDILHYGHIRLLEYAKSLGDELIVAINSDASVQRLKGCDRPIIPFKQRLLTLRALRCVDFVCGFEDDTPLKLIEEIHPHILVKGPEAINAPIPGADFVRSYGGEVIVPSWEVDISTTSILKRLQG